MMRPSPVGELRRGAARPRSIHYTSVSSYAIWFDLIRSRIQ